MNQHAHPWTWPDGWMVTLSDRWSVGRFHGLTIGWPSSNGAINGQWEGRLGEGGIVPRLISQIVRQLEGQMAGWSDG